MRAHLTLYKKKCGKPVENSDRILKSLKFLKVIKFWDQRNPQDAERRAGNRNKQIENMKKINGE